MPVHFNSIMKPENEEKVFNAILKKNLDNPDDVFVPQKKDRFLIINNIVDKNTNKNIGKTTITFVTRNNAHELVDVDITLNNSNKTKLLFEEKYEKSSESNEYYLVSFEDNVRFTVETVGRYRVEEKEIEETEKDVYLSAFPFQLDICDSMDKANEILGFDKPIETIDGIQVNGFSETFMGDGLNRESPNSLVIGIIKSYNDVKAIISGEVIDFTIINIETAIGILPVAVCKENFDITNIKENMILVMFANIKAEF